MFDYIIRNGRVIDGSGGEAYDADIAVLGGMIAAIGPNLDGDAREEIDASGLIVTPGFVDPHTHYDGQITWDDELLPSADHGVTTVISGACGIGFAPVRPGTEDWLIRIMEGVEDIPGSALHVGIPWGWESFEDYMDFIAGREFSLDVALHVPHSAVRAYVLGERAAEDPEATEAEVDEIARIVADAVRSGAVGFGTSRMSVHRASDGGIVPGTRAPHDELLHIARAIREAGGAVMQLLPSGTSGNVEGDEGEAMRVGLVAKDQYHLTTEIEMMRQLAETSGSPVTFTFTENANMGRAMFEAACELISEFADRGVPVHPQFATRPIGGLVSLDTYHPFQGRPTYRALADLPLAERAAAMADPATKAAILADDEATIDSADPRHHTHLTLQRHLANIYSLAALDYEPDPSTSMAGIAAAEGRDGLEVIYDHLIADDGQAVLVWLATGYVDGNLDRIREFLEDDQYVVGLGDGGAHVLFISDATYPTFVLTHWGRDRTRGDTVRLETLVRRLSLDTARLYGLDDRGVLEVGRRADLNVIDYDKLRLRLPALRNDLPTGARRFVQAADGYRLTMVNGVVTRRDGADTGARPGRLVRRAAARA